jgi:hypothetical protein
MSACVEVPWNSAGLVIETGRPVVHVVAGIGVGEQAVGHWMRVHELRRKLAIRAIAASSSLLARLELSVAPLWYHPFSPTAPNR